MAVEAGTYVILSAASTGLALDVSGNSDSTNGRRVQLWTRFDNDAQLVRFIPTGSNWYIQFLLSGKQLTRTSDTNYVAIRKTNNSVTYMSNVGGNTYRNNYDKLWVHSSADSAASSRIGYLTLGQTVTITSTVTAGGIVYGVYTTGTGTENQTKIVQWDSSSNGSQNWQVVADGKTVTVGGTAYPTYVIRHPSITRALDITNGSYTAGNFLQLCDINGSDAQRWALIPQNPIPDGTYEICPYVNNKNCIDVAGESTAIGANAWLWSRLDQNNQKWVVSTDSDGISTITDNRTGYVLDVQNGKAYNGANVQVYSSNGSDAQKWVIDPATITNEVNDQTSPYYRIHAKLDTGYVMDNNGGGTANGTNLIIWAHDPNSYNQLFRFEPTEYLASDLPVPSSLGVSLTDGGDNQGSVISLADDSDYSVYPRFNCAGTAYQMRYRYRARSFDMDSADAGEYGAWQSVLDGSSSNDGWGDIQTANCEVTQSGNVNWAKAFTGTVSTTATDLVEYQYEVRRYATTWGKAGGAAHGNSATGSFKVVITPTVTITGLTMTPTGLAVSYESTFPRGENTITLSCPALFEDYTLTNALAADSVVVPYDMLLSVPSEGDSYTVTLALTTLDGGEGNITSAHTVSYDSEHGTGIDVECKVENSLNTMTVDGESVVYLEVERGHGNRLVPFTSDANGKVTIIPPLNKAYKVYVVKGKVTGGDSWATKVMTFPAIADSAYHITALDASHDVTIELGEGQPPTFTPSYARDITFATTTGRERNVAAMGTTTVATWPLNGVMYETFNGPIVDHDAAFDIAAHMGFCVFRAPNGFWAQAAITAASNDMTRDNVHTASFSFKEIEV